MGTNHLIKCLTISAFLAIGTSNVVKADNITIWDKNGDSNSSEVGEVEPGMQATSNWWLDGFEYDAATHKLSIKSGGFDFNGHLTGGEYGDIFIKTGPAAPTFGDFERDGGKENSLVFNDTGYDYVFHINMATHHYDLFSIGTSSRVKTAAEPLNVGSTPWRYESDGNKVGSGDNVYFTSNTLSGFDLSFLNGQEFWAHNTMQCGNDNLMGHYAPVPEPATMLLFGTGLAGLAGARLRRKKQ